MSEPTDAQISAAIETFGLKPSWEAMRRALIAAAKAAPAGPDAITYGNDIMGSAQVAPEPVAWNDGSCLTRWHLDNWPDSSFKAHIPAVRHTLDRLFDALAAPPASVTEAVLPDKVLGDPTTLTFSYTNWRGEKSMRTVRPIRIWFGATKYHPASQWFLKAIDAEKDAERDFALADVKFDLSAVTEVAPEPSERPSSIVIVSGHGRMPYVEVKFTGLEEAHKFCDWLHAALKAARSQPDE